MKIRVVLSDLHSRIQRVLGSLFCIVLNPDQKQMIEIRPIWHSGSLNPKGLNAEICLLLAIEQRISAASDVYLRLAREVIDEEYIDDLSSLDKSARTDLIGGCEMARTGYLKQAYSLWRSWFEQTIFYLYFLEAPLHRAAWLVKTEISQDDSPRYKLMLHQLLADSSEKHPFAIVYESRYTQLTNSLKISNIPKTQRPIQRSIRVLTTLSQGVHGTYQPQSAQNIDGLSAQVAKHCRPVLESAEQLINTYWILLLTDMLALPEDVLFHLREGKATPEDLKAAGVDQAEYVAALAPFFSQTFPPAQSKNG